MEQWRRLDQKHRLSSGDQKLMRLPVVLASFGTKKRREGGAYSGAGLAERVELNLRCHSRPHLFCW